MLDILITIAPVFVLIGIGSLIRTVKIANESWIEVLNNFALYIGFPALIFTNLVSSNDNNAINYSLFFINSFIIFSYLVFLFFVTKLFKFKKEISNCYILGAVFGNTAYLGYPYISSLLPGSELIISLIISSYIIVVFTAGLWVLETSLDNSSGIFVIFKNVFKNPLLLSVLFGIIFTGFDIPVPAVFEKTLKMAANAASPVVLIALGIFLVNKFELNVRFVHALSITFLKIIILPLVFYVLFNSFFADEALSVPLLEAGMPAGITLFALAQKYPLDNTIIVYLIIISSVLSAISLPVLSLFFLA